MEIKDKLEDKKSRETSRFLSFFKKIGINIKTSFQNFANRFKDGSIGTKLSHFFMGAGNFYHKQFIKGVIYLSIQIGFLTLLIASPKVNNTPIGFKSLVNLITLGTEEGSFELGIP
ncbi:MAG: hypothetical protein RBR50_04785, partial [Candidatus Izemoplasmatales bacterium]|nr:hypothetical protein [Candidatus Izemoplasmatales bacterium]